MFYYKITLSVELNLTQMDTSHLPVVRKIRIKDIFFVKSQILFFRYKDIVIGSCLVQQEHYRRQ